MHNKVVKAKKFTKLKDWKQFRANVNKALVRAGGEPLKKSWYWSSSEYSSHYAWLSGLGSSYGLYYNYDKDDGYYVRPVLAL